MCPSFLRHSERSMVCGHPKRVSNYSCLSLWVPAGERPAHYLMCCRPQLAKGLMQLYSFEQSKSQPLEAHAAAFANVKVCHI